MTEAFWFNDFSVLYKNYTSFFPKPNDTRIEQLNSIARFSIYLFILLLCFGNNNYDNMTWLYLPIFFVFMTVILYKTADMQADNTIIIRKNLDGTEDEVSGVDISKTDDGFGTDYGTDYTDTADVNECYKPTDDNPFMNVLLSDYEENPLKKPACNYDYEIEDGLTIRDDAINKFNKHLFRNVEDTYEKKNSQRTYMSMPSTTIPNNQTKFAKWCYGIPETCKENQKNCLRYEAVRSGKKNFPYKYVI
jgi:hypothetical protein